MGVKKGESEIQIRRTPGGTLTTAGRSSPTGGVPRIRPSGSFPPTPARLPTGSRRRRWALLLLIPAGWLIWKAGNGYLSAFRDEQPDPPDNTAPLPPSPSPSLPPPEAPTAGLPGQPIAPASAVTQRSSGANDSEPALRSKAASRPLGLARGHHSLAEDERQKAKAKDKGAERNKDKTKDKGKDDKKSKNEPEDKELALDEGPGEATGSGSASSSDFRRVSHFVASGGANLKGKVVESDTGKPVTSASVEARLGGQRMETRTDGAGNFAMEGMLPGSRVTVWVTGDRETFVSERSDVLVPGGGEWADVGTIRLLRGSELGADLRGWVGVFVTRRAGKAVVSAVAPWQAADRAGIQADDILVSVDGRDLAGLGSRAVNFILRGKVGTQTDIVVQTPGQKPRKVTVRRTLR